MKAVNQNVYSRREAFAKSRFEAVTSDDSLQIYSPICQSIFNTNDLPNFSSKESTKCSSSNDQPTDKENSVNNSLTQAFDEVPFIDEEENDHPTSSRLSSEVSLTNIIDKKNLRKSMTNSVLCATLGIHDANCAKMKVLPRRLRFMKQNTTLIGGIELVVASVDESLELHSKLLGVDEIFNKNKFRSMLNLANPKSASIARFNSLSLFDCRSKLLNDLVSLKPTSFWPKISHAINTNVQNAAETWNLKESKSDCSEHIFSSSNSSGSRRTNPSANTKNEMESAEKIAKWFSQVFLGDLVPLNPKYSANKSMQKLLMQFYQCKLNMSEGCSKEHDQWNSFQYNSSSNTENTKENGNENRINKSSYIIYSLVPATNRRKDSREKLKKALLNSFESILEDKKCQKKFFL